MRMTRILPTPPHLTPEAESDVRRINYRSDFALELAFRGGTIPACAWEIELSTPGTEMYNIYRAGFDGRHYRRCTPLSETRVLLFVDNHRLRPGPLRYELKMHIAAEKFPDGDLCIVCPAGGGIILWDGPSDDCSVSAEITAVNALVEEYESYLHFPTIGKELHLYIDTDAGKTYRWNAEKLHYECIGSDYNDIDLIDSGNAWGLKNRE